MNLDFRLLAIDDNPDLESSNAIDKLEAWLKNQGFRLEYRQETELSESRMQTVIEHSGEKLDLVIVDYDLGHKERTGTKVVEELRRQLRYTEMVVYSALQPERDLLMDLAKSGVDGVFVATSQRLGEVLANLADVVIGKSVDLTHMRGIAMAEVAEQEVLMRETLECLFDARHGRIAESVGREMGERLLKGKDRNLQKLRDLVEQRKWAQLWSGRWVTANDRAIAIEQAVTWALEKPRGAEFNADDYRREILEERNALAHGSKSKVEQRVDRERMIRFRKTLQKYTHLLKGARNAILGTIEQASDGGAQGG